MTGSAGGNTFNGGDGNDSINGGAGGDILIGGVGADTIDTGAVNDNVRDIIRYTSVDEFGDTVTNFDTNGPNPSNDRVEFRGALNVAWDDGNNNSAFLFVSSNGTGGTVNVTVGQADANAEALLLSGIAGEGVTTARRTSTADLREALHVIREVDSDLSGWRIAARPCRALADGPWAVRTLGRVMLDTRLGRARIGADCTGRLRVQKGQAQRWKP